MRSHEELDAMRPPELIRIEQIALYTPDLDATKKELKLSLGLDEWKDDVVTAVGLVFGQPTQSTARLSFNYQLGYEFELLRYMDGNNWHAARNTNLDTHAFLSHKGTHVTDMDAEKSKYFAMGWQIAQELFTINHTSEYLQQTGRKYHYVVWDSRDRIGFDLKLIRRITGPNEAPESKGPSIGQF